MKKLLAAILITLFTGHASAATVTDVEAALDKNDIPLAFKLAKPLADKGHTEVLYFVGQTLYDGKHVAQNYKLAIHYFKLCADNPKTDDETIGLCLYDMAGAYILGNGVAKDSKLAWNYMWKSAQHGNPQAFKILANKACDDSDASCPMRLHKKLKECASLDQCDQ